MIRRPPRPTRTVTLLPNTTLFRTGSQYPISGRTASPDPDGTFRLTGADISDVPAGPANLIEYFSWTDGLGRSEEHTSELQSVMRISYAVFCLKTNKHTTTRILDTNIYT